MLCTAPMPHHYTFYRFSWSFVANKTFLACAGADSPRPPVSQALPSMSAIEQCPVAGNDKWAFGILALCCTWFKYGDNAVAAVWLWPAGRCRVGGGVGERAVGQSRKGKQKWFEFNCMSGEMAVWFGAHNLYFRRRSFGRKVWFFFVFLYLECWQILALRLKPFWGESFWVEKTFDSKLFYTGFNSTGRYLNQV